MKFFYVAACLVPSLVLSVNLNAQSEAHEEDSHSFLQLSHVTEYEAAEDIRLNGISLLGRYDLAEKSFLRAEIERVSGSGIEEKAAEIALAYILNPHNTVELHIAGLYSYGNEKENGFSQSSNTYGAEIGFHAATTEHLTLHGELAWLDETGGSVVGAELGAFYRLTEHFGLNAEYARDENSNDAIEVGVRVSF